VITNGPGDTQRHKLAATGIDQHFDAIVISGEVGVAKPDPPKSVLRFDRANLPRASTGLLQLDHRAEVRSL
jgi:phosphoglycolate phosphatase-like HAD superfamily hydrolase